MALVNFLSLLWGISLTAVCLAMLVNEKYLKNIFDKVEQEIVLFGAGLISFVIGLAMVLSYNVWAYDWRVIVTILGWLALIKGLSLLFIPQQVKNLVIKFENATFLPYVLIVAVFIGLIITYLGFTV